MIENNKKRWLSNQLFEQSKNKARSSFFTTKHLIENLVFLCNESDNY